MERLGKPGAIEPTAVEKITPETKFGMDMPSAKVEAYLNDTFGVSPFMRRLGFTSNPRTCAHYRKRMYLGMERFQCSDCGALL